MHLNTVSIGAASTYILSNCAKAFLSLHILLNACYFFFLIKAFLEDMRWYLIMLLICIFWWLVVLSTFSCTYWQVVCILLKKCLFRFSAHFLKIRFFFFFCNWVVWLPCVFWILILTRNIICKYFLQFHRLIFHFGDGFLHWAEDF